MTKVLTNIFTVDMLRYIFIERIHLIYIIPLRQSCKKLAYTVFPMSYLEDIIEPRHAWLRHKLQPAPTCWEDIEMETPPPICDIYNIQQAYLYGVNTKNCLKYIYGRPSLRCIFFEVIFRYVGLITTYDSYEESRYNDGVHGLKLYFKYGIIEGFLSPLGDFSFKVHSEAAKMNVILSYTLEDILCAWRTQLLAESQ